MSHVTAVLLMVNIGANEPPDELLAAVNAYETQPRLRWITEHFGGTKHPQAEIAGGGCNYLHEDGFVAHLRSLPWESWEVDWAQVAMQGEHNDGFALVEVFRADTADPAGW